MSFLDFIFYPTIVATIVAVIAEQVIRRASQSERAVLISMGFRKFFYRQALIVNLLWFLGYAILMFTVGRQAPQQMPDMIWQG